jgi:hypothetical protein
MVGLLPTSALVTHNPSGNREIFKLKGVEVMRSQSIVIAGMIILTLALATAAMAADPLIGTWKLNVTKSTISQTQPFNVTFREIEGDKIEVTTTSINADGSAISAISVRATWPRMGGPVQILQGGNEALSYFVILVEPGNWYQAIVRDGRQVALRHITFSKDGKVMTQTIKGGWRDAPVKPFEDVLVFDKQ